MMSKETARRPLTAKEAKFCAEYQIDRNQTSAARRAGYSAKSASSIANEMMQKPHIRARLQELEASADEAREVQASEVRQGLRQAFKEAMAAGHYSAAVRALELEGKTIGMFVDRSETTLNTVSDEELCRQIARSLPGLTEEQRANFFQAKMQDLGHQVPADAYHSAEPKSKPVLQ
jgi:hypothetical protein